MLDAGEAAAAEALCRLRVPARGSAKGGAGRSCVPARRGGGSTGVSTRVRRAVTRREAGWAVAAARRHFRWCWLVPPAAAPAGWRMLTRAAAGVRHPEAPSSWEEGRDTPQEQLGSVTKRLSHFYVTGTR